MSSGRAVCVRCLTAALDTRYFAIGAGPAHTRDYIVRSLSVFVNSTPKFSKTTSCCNRIWRWRGGVVLGRGGFGENSHP